MKAIPAVVVNLWLPLVLGAGLVLLLAGEPLPYWTICLPLLPLLAYMNTLASIRAREGEIQIQRWWGSKTVPKDQIQDISPSALEGVCRLRLRHFVAPWGSVYFVSDWSDAIVSRKNAEAEVCAQGEGTPWVLPSWVGSSALALSGFILGRVLSNDFHALLTEEYALGATGIAVSAILAVLFVVTRKRTPVLANVMLFCAMMVAAMVRMSQ
ncbi:hypothetical protein [Nevskia soli]|uniref:hypothetical protein n=1 Tax=Nevskia soli TaxID=418856 RepID=UPI0015D70477|nr:hypothetical protein [Nevskia soli]